VAKVKTEIMKTRSGINPNLQVILDNEVTARNRMIREGLRFHRDRGKVIARVREGKSLDGKSNVDYGPKPIDVLSDYLGIKRSYIYKLATFYEIYEDNDKFQDLLDKFDDNQFHLSWSHFNCLVHVNDPQMREEIIEEAVKNKMSVRSLHKLLEDRRIQVSQDSDEIIDASVVEDTDAATNLTAPSVDVNPEPPAARSATTSRDVDSEEDSHVDVLVSNPKTLLKKLVSSAGNFGDKLVDIVGDLTISLNEVNGASAHKDVFKGLSSAKEVLNSLKQQISEYTNQVAEIERRLLDEKGS